MYVFEMAIMHLFSLSNDSVKVYRVLSKPRAKCGALFMIVYKPVTFIMGVY